MCRYQLISFGGPEIGQEPYHDFSFPQEVLSFLFNRVLGESRLFRFWVLFYHVFRDHVLHGDPGCTKLHDPFFEVKREEK